MKRRWIWIGTAAAVLVLAGGGVYYARSRPAAQPQQPRDPGFLLLLSIRTLERTPETRLSKEQIEKILPFIRALKDIPLSDGEAAFVIVRAVRDTFTPEQRVALEEARKRFQERVRAQGIPGAGAGAAPGAAGAGPGGAGGGEGLTDEERAQRRARMFERMIRYLERRTKS